MSSSLDANVLIYASDESSRYYRKAVDFLGERVEGSDLICLSWITIMAYQRISTHPAIFKNPLSPAVAWGNISRLLARPRVRVI
ncbi:MAG: VapC toxin family PIN domain ribonuclease, partial [Terrimicrobiaceae bacterium]